jgi:hypothetical protein
MPTRTYTSEQMIAILYDEDLESKIISIYEEHVFQDPI